MTVDKGISGLGFVLLISVLAFGFGFYALAEAALVNTDSTTQKAGPTFPLPLGLVAAFAGYALLAFSWAYRVRRPAQKPSSAPERPRPELSQGVDQARRGAELHQVKK